LAGYGPGDKGTVLRGIAEGPSGKRYYLVSMDKDDASSGGVVLTEAEIDADL
jgi:hypothetical protein